MTLMGLFMLHNILGTLEMDELVNAAAAAPNFAYLLVAGLLVLFGFGVKAGMYPLHTWLPQSYVAAPGPATALLSAILSKAGIFGILVITANVFLHNFTWGMILLVLAVLTMVTGAVLAVFSTNFKRTLACSSMSQIGFILVGIAMQAILGEHNAIAVQGSFLHLLNHSMIKLPLFMVASIIFICMKEFDLNKIRGFGRRKPLLAIITVIPMLGVAGVPLFNGFISKSITISAAAAAHYGSVELLLQLAGVGTFLSIALKMIYFIFLAPDNGVVIKREVPKNMYVAMGIGATLCVLYGVYPELLYRYLPFTMEPYHPFTVDHITQSIEMLGMAMLPFMMYLPKMAPHTALSLDTDWFYRKPFAGIVTGLSYLCCAVSRALGNTWEVLYEKSMELSHNPMEFLDAKPLRNSPKYNPENYRTSIADPIMITLTILFCSLCYFMAII